MDPTMQPIALSASTHPSHDSANKPACALAVNTCNLSLTLFSCALYSFYLIPLVPSPTRAPAITTGYLYCYPNSLINSLLLLILLILITMSSIVQSFRKRDSSAALPVSQTHFSKDQAVAGLRRRLSSLSLKIQPISSPATQWAFQRSKSVSAMGEYAGSSVKKWWDWGWSWILSRKPVFAQDLEMNEEETRVLGCHRKGSWGHVFYKFRSEVIKLARSGDKAVLPQTCRSI
ncbi:hypothetical protein NC651_023266 [Populus alba x Populus x berolinensis]|nr:hypothetical protein NC651_023266 [Populus alba x Populus x berolinensis]